MIIPALIHMESVDAIVQQCMRLGALDFDPFRLIVASIGGCIELASNGVVIRCRSAVLPGRIAMFTSSGLGDQLVDGPRRRLFEAMLGDGRHDVGGQDAFHQHQWLDRPHLSVRMARPDALTVSRTTIELCENQVAMRYASLDEQGHELDPASHALPIDAIEGTREIDLAEGVCA